MQRGECDYSQHGANRLGANSLLSAIYGGMVAGPEAVNYIDGLEKVQMACPLLSLIRLLKRRR